MVTPCLIDRMRAEVGRICQRLALVIEMIKGVDAERDAVIASPKPIASAPQKAAQLVRLRGIGPQAATVLAHEVFYRHFGNRRELGSYLGLTPSPYSSGAVHRSQGISKAGNARARATAIELAWLWLRYQPQSALAGWFRHYVGEHRGRVKKIAIVALARKLVVALWRYLEAGVVPGGAELKPV